MNTRLPKLVASAALVLTLATACGGGRPSADELSEALQSDDNAMGIALEEQQADCLAEAFVDSDVSDDALQAIVDGDEDYEGDEDDEKALASISTDSMAECMAG